MEKGSPLLLETIIGENKNELYIGIDSYGADKSWETLDSVGQNYPAYKMYHESVASLMTDKIQTYHEQNPDDVEIAALCEAVESIKNTSKLNLCPKMTQYQFTIVCNLIIDDVCSHLGVGSACFWPNLAIGSSDYMKYNTTYTVPTFPDNISIQDPMLLSMRDNSNRAIMNALDTAYMTGHMLKRFESPEIPIQSACPIFSECVECKNRRATVMFGENSKIILGVDGDNLEKMPLYIRCGIATQPSNVFLMDYTDISYVAPDENGNPVTQYVFPEAANAEWDGVFSVPFTWHNLYKVVAETEFVWQTSDDMKGHFLHEYDTDSMGHAFAGRRGYKFALIEARKNQAFPWI